MTMRQTTSTAPLTFARDDQRWQAVIQRDASADGAFYYSVKSTGVYCRPSCPARLANRKNVCFHATTQDAERAGFRACKRCRPKQSSLRQQHGAVVSRACRLIENAGASLGLESLAASLGFSPSHFHRVFKSLTGVTPKAYSAAVRAERVRDGLVEGRTVTTAAYNAGFNSSGRFYATTAQVLGMTPSTFRTGGQGTTIRLAVGECSLGSILVAASEKGICTISLGDDPGRLVRELQDRFPQAELSGGNEAFENMVAQVVGFVERPSLGLDLPLDVQGTAFQRRVWELLRQIPCGKTVSYSELAQRLGEPKAVRAVASACAANQIAVAIPCHRIVRMDGSLSGYRWGVERKAALLELERTGT
jgi:AraC family transcriptional regulator, regulatory protein of adaptative response / methylated-DNA-[protein]-cysteine methyltransferase